MAVAGLVPVEVDGVLLLVEVVDAGGGGAADISDRRWDLEQVQASIRKVAEVAHRALLQVAPDEATVEFGMAIKTEAGRLTGLLVSGGTEANFKISLTWRRAETSASDEVAGTQGQVGR